MDLPFERHRPRKIRIKLEIDVNPPAGSTVTTSYITFPVTAPLTTQSLESGFALKLRALLCRPYHLARVNDSGEERGPTSWAGCRSRAPKATSVRARDVGVLPRATKPSPSTLSVRV